VALFPVAVFVVIRLTATQESEGVQLAARAIITKQIGAEQYFLPRTVGIEHTCITSKHIGAVPFSGRQSNASHSPLPKLALTRSATASKAAGAVPGN
jgi:hypothetical protein